MELKTCTKCGKTKPTGHFFLNRASRSGLMAKCKLCSTAEVLQYRKDAKEKIRVQRKAYRVKHKEKLRKQYTDWQLRNSEKQKRRQLAWRLRVKYGIDETTFAQMKVDQAGVCAICHRIPKRWHVDHNHSTGKARGLLCSNCNTALGLVHESESTLRNAIRYLERHA